MQLLTDMRARSTVVVWGPVGRSMVDARVQIVKLLPPLRNHRGECHWRGVVAVKVGHDSLEFAMVQPIPPEALEGASSIQINREHWERCVVPACLRHFYRRRGGPMPAELELLITLTPPLSQGEREQQALTPPLSQGEREQQALTPLLSQGEREQQALTPLLSQGEREPDREPDQGEREKEAASTLGWLMRWLRRG